ncbi:MAG: ABC transporter permease [Acidimicrobiales bacterium]
MRSFLQNLWSACRRDKTALIGAIVILFFLVMAIIGPYIAHLGVPSAVNAYLSPSMRHPLGTDALGQDVLAELVLGTRPVMEVGILAATITVAIGVVVGLVTGYLGGVVDAVMMRITDVFLTIPGLPLIIVIASLLQTTSPFVLAGILSVTAWAGLARAVRSQALSLRSTDFIEASRVQGLPLRNIVGRQLLPNVGPYVAIHFLLDVTGAIYAEVGLFLLGIAPINGTNWGEMINVAMSQGAMFTTRSMSSLFSPMVTIVILQVAFVFFARALDVVFNPRLRTQ